MKVLVIEDDLATAEHVSRGLNANGHQFSHTSDGKDGLSQALKGEFEVLVIDRMLPGMEGLSIVKTLRPCTTPNWHWMTTTPAYALRLTFTPPERQGLQRQQQSWQCQTIRRAKPSPSTKSSPVEPQWRRKLKCPWHRVLCWASHPSR